MGDPTAGLHTNEELEEIGLLTVRFAMPEEHIALDRPARLLIPGSVLMSMLLMPL